MPPLEVSAAAGTVGTSYMFMLNQRDSHLRVLAAPSRTATVTNVGGGTIRQATVNNAGTYGAFADLNAGSSQAVVAADGAREFVFQNGDTATVRVVVS